MANIKITKENDAKQLNWIIILRITLGLILFWKAINFIRDTSTAKSLIERSGIEVFSQHSEVLAFIIDYLGMRFIYSSRFSYESSIYYSNSYSFCRSILCEY